MKVSVTYFAWSVMILAGCATTPEDSKISSPKEPYYTLKEGEPRLNPLPLPNITPVIVEWTYPDGAQTSKVGFRGWDFGHFGHANMLEVIDDQGRVVGRAYDFNGGGHIDKLEKPKGTELTIEAW